MRRFYLLFMFILFALAGCAGLDKSAQAPDGKVYELMILNTNDHHGSIDPELYDQHDQPLKDGPIGGIAERATLIRQARATHENVLLLDAGDLTATDRLLSGYYDGVLDIKLYDLLGYDAVAIGNNEFQRGVKHFQDQIVLANFPFIAANVKYADGTYVGKPWIVKDYKGFRVGIFGLLTTLTKEVDATDGIIISDETTAAKEAVDYLRNKEKCDVVIAITHIGIPRKGNAFSSLNIAREVDGIDLIIDGHTHTYMDKAVVENGVPIVSAEEYGRYLGEGIMKISGGKVISFDWQPVPVRGIPADAEIAAVIAPYAAAADEAYDKVIGSAEADFTYGDGAVLREETAIGDLVCDSLAWYTNTKLGVKTDFAFINGGSIRAGITKGDIRLKDTFSVIRFNNNITVVTLTGSDLLKFFGRVASFSRGSKGWGQVSSGVSYTIKYDGDEGMLAELKVNGKKVQPDAVYTFATIDFITGGGNGHTLKADSIKIADTGVNARTALIDYIKYKKIIKPAAGKRINIAGEAALSR